MITCNRCGKQIPAGAANCSNCGMPISSLGRGNTDAQEQQALPTWLESLRANERPRTPASGQSFSTSDLVDDDDLPGWMRPERAAMAEDVNANQYSAPRQSSMPAPNTDDSMLPPKGFSANSLIDSASLPAWVKSDRSASQGPGEAQGPFSAASLIEPDSLPDWLREQQSSPPPMQSQPGSKATWSAGGATPFNSFNPPQQAPTGRVDPETPPHMMSAQDFIDPQALPGWMSGQPGQPGQANQPGQMAQSTWQQGPSHPTQPAQGGTDRGAGLSASSLLDVNALPNWLREEQPGQPGQGGANSNLSAGSLIDMNALPDWLRNADSQPGPQQGGYGTSGRIESMRVPSRPRAEMAPQEQSEVAANVFTSMLGVASTAPSYPAQPSPFAGQPQQGFPNAPAQPPNMNIAGQPVPPGFAGPPPMQGVMPAGYSGGYSGAYQGGQSGQGGYPSGNAAPGPVPIQFPGMSPDAFNAGRPSANLGNQVNQAEAKPAKRSFIDTIREWFHL